MDKSKILVTGSAGFIGMHTSLRLHKMGYEVIGIDNLNTYYSVDLKLARLHEQGIDTNQVQYNSLIKGELGIGFIQLDVTDAHNLNALFEKEHFDYVIHLAAQAGVRYSMENPHAYIDSNIKGFMNILEACRANPVKHLIYASSSSVYGLNEKVPFNEKDQADRQVSLYAASKKANESMAHSYAAMFKLPVTGLRFFTVYGPWGRPDMALFKFTKNILKDLPIDVYNHGNLSRDFTYIDDIVSGVTSLVTKESSKDIPYHVFNIGNGNPVKLMDFIISIEVALDKKAIINSMEMQPGDVEKTNADTSSLHDYVGYSPTTNIQQGVTNFVNWFRQYYSREEIVSFK